jgi:probable phosphoglycerate mutase
MTEAPLVVVRHGTTEWSETGRHTGRTDVPLLPSGREQARALAGVLDRDEFDRVLCSPLRRARETCELAGFGDGIEIFEELREWDYGDYEGLTTPEIRERNPGWDMWRDGCPGGESPAEVAARVDSVLSQLGAARAIAFAHGHVLRVLAARWIGLEAAEGARVALSPGAIGRLGHEHERRVIERWNISVPPSL